MNTCLIKFNHLKQLSYYFFELKFFICKMMLFLVKSKHTQRGPRGQYDKCWIPDAFMNKKKANKIYETKQTITQLIKKILVLVDNFCNLLNNYFLPIIHDQWSHFWRKFHVTFILSLPHFRRYYHYNQLEVRWTLKQTTKVNDKAFSLKAKII